MEFYSQVLPPYSYPRYYLLLRIDELAQEEKQKDMEMDREKWKQIVRSIESFIDPEAYKVTYREPDKLNGLQRPNDTGKPITEVENLDEKIRKLLAKRIKKAIQ